MIKSKKQMFIVIGVFFLVMLLGTVTYAFFNYTRTGSANTISVGRIAFNSTQNGTINLTNVFPISSTSLGTDVGNHGEVTINITGDTTYSEGIEYLISFSNLNTTVNDKIVPIKYSVTPTNLGEEATSYWTQRGGSTSYYHILDTDEIRDGKYVAVGYIKSGSTGVNGNLLIKAYIDANDVAITDTQDENTSWQNGRVVLTTSEWNSLINTPLSFKVKVEANEGIWVRESPTPASCFEINVLSEEDHTAEITNYNGGEIKTYTINSNMTQEQLNACTSFLASMAGGVAEDFEAFCEGTGAYQGIYFQDLISSGVDMSYFEENGIVIGNIDENQLCRGNVEIPKTINGYTVVKISDGTYFNSPFFYKNIKSVVIPNSVTTIGNYAFQSNQLTSVVIPNSVTTIGENAFYHNKIASVTIPNSVTSIGSGVFWNNELTSVTIPNSITTIGVHAFADNQLTSVIIPDSVTTIGGFAFGNNKLTSVTIPNSVTSIDYGAFNNNQLPDNQALIYKRTDTNNDGIAEIDTTTIMSYGGSNKDVVIPNTVTAIGADAFSACQIASVVIPDTIISIGSQAFNNNQLTSVTMPDSVRTIGRMAFSNNQLTSVTIGNGITSIGDTVFFKNESSNPNLTSITINKTCSTIKSMSYYSWIGNTNKTGTTIYGANNEVCDAF